MSELDNPSSYERVTASGLTGIRVITGYGVDAGAAAVVQLRDGSAAGAIIASARFGASGAGNWSLPAVATVSRVYVEIVSGAPTVTVYGR